MRLVTVFACLLLPPLAACVRSSVPPAADGAETAQTALESSRNFAVAPASGSVAEARAPSSAANSGPAKGEASADEGEPLRADRSTPRERPGLGTVWGETRTSYVTSRAFERADRGPWAQLSLKYNDSTGIRAALAHAGRNTPNVDSSGIRAGQGPLKVRLLDEQGRPIPSARWGGRDYVTGNDGQRYSIEISNETGVRFEAVASVDGLDVIDGQPGSLDKRGYLIEPRSTLQIDGFRRSEENVAAFRFGAVKDSYAASTGSDRNVGVIGVAFFQEQGQTWPWTDAELERRDSANPFPGRFASPPVRPFVPIAR